MATNTDADGGQSGNSRQTQMEEQSAMLPELPNEVWTLVLGKLEAVGDFGRLQQVSRPFNAAITDVGWTKIKKIATDNKGHLNVLIRVNEQELFLPMEKRVQLVAELAKKAINITDVVVVIRPGAIWWGNSQAPVIQEYVEFLGRALDKLATSSMKIGCFEIVGDLILMTPAFPSLAQFIHANIETLEKVRIWDCCVFRHQGLQFPAELLQAIQQCSQLETASVLAYPYQLSVPLFESLINGKSHLKTLDIHSEDASYAPAILDLEAQLVKFTCCSELLRNYAAELGCRGLSATDQHPLRTIKNLCIGDGLLPSFSLMPNLEQLEFDVVIRDVQEDVIPFVSRFLTDYMFTPEVKKCWCARSGDLLERAACRSWRTRSRGNSSARRRSKRWRMEAPRSLSPVGTPVSSFAWLIFLWRRTRAMKTKRDRMALLDNDLPSQF